MRRRFLLSAALGVAVGVAGETLLFMRTQSRAVERSLRDDFRVLLYLKSDADAGKLKVLEEQLRALPDVEDARAVSKQEQLAALRRDDPELVESVLLVGDNPLQTAFEVRLGEGAVAQVGQWLLRARALADFSDARYKPSQVQAILQAQFYARFLDVALAALVCLGAGAAALGLWLLRLRPAGKPGESFWLLAAGGLGAVAGAAAIGVVVLPMRELSPWWAWPPAGAQAALVLAAAASGWVLCSRAD